MKGTKKPKSQTSLKKPLKKSNSLKNSTQEYNFDGLVGPTHNYAGLSFGNIASMSHKGQKSNPQKAALQGLKKMKLLMDKGFKQAVLPPHERPNIKFLKSLGFSGPYKNLLSSVEKCSPALLSSCYSSSSMWTANSATVSPAMDTQDRKTHITPANLQSFLHRFLETEWTAFILKKVFFNPQFFTHHSPLPSSPALSDEGAANHLRLSKNYSSKGVEVFVYGRKKSTSRFYARQSETASKVIALRHKVGKKLFVEQHPKAISAGAFHNDVVCTVDQNLIFYHELAFAHTKLALKKIKKSLSPTSLLEILVPAKEVSLKTAVSSYLFNSQLLPIGKNQWMLLAPEECKKQASVKKYLQFLNQNSVIKETCFVPLNESMKNGGGPACLRLKVPLTQKSVTEGVHKGVLLNDTLYKQLKKWIKKHYRESLYPKDLKDPDLIRESHTALDELSQLLKIGNIYSFQ